VGLEFLLEEKDHGNTPARKDERTGVDLAQMQEFLRMYKEASPQE
jgi:hypothetical protein